MIPEGCDVFDWDDANVEHLARHGVSRDEAETVLLDPLGLIIDSTVQEQEIRYRYVGSTMNHRLLIVAFTMRDELIRPITAFDADRYTARRYREGK